MNIVQLFIFFTFVIIINIQTGCSPDSMKVSNAEAKFDAPLRNKISKIQQAKADSSLKCFVKFIGNFDETKREKLQESGAKVLNVLKDIVIIEGKHDTILKVASLDFVQSISLSQTRYSPD